MPTPSRSDRSTFGRRLHAPARRSSPNQDTISDTEPQPGTSSDSWSSDVPKSVLPEGVFTLALTFVPNPSSKCTGVVARAYSPVPGISATALTSCPGPAVSISPSGTRAARATSKLNCGTRLPNCASCRFSITT